MVMIDRVARAIYAAAPARFVTGSSLQEPIPWNSAGEDTKTTYRELARAALLPLRDDPDGSLHDVGGMTIEDMRAKMPNMPGKVLAGHALSAMMTQAIGEAS